MLNVAWIIVLNWVDTQANRRLGNRKRIWYFTKGCQNLSTNGEGLKNFGWGETFRKQSDRKKNTLPKKRFRFWKVVCGSRIEDTTSPLHLTHTLSKEGVSLTGDGRENRSDSPACFRIGYHLWRKTSLLQPCSWLWQPQSHIHFVWVTFVILSRVTSVLQTPNAPWVWCRRELRGGPRELYLEWIVVHTLKRTLGVAPVPPRIAVRGHDCTPSSFLTCKTLQWRGPCFVESILDRITTLAAHYVALQTQSKFQHMPSPRSFRFFFAQHHWCKKMSR